MHYSYHVESWSVKCCGALGDPWTRLSHPETRTQHPWVLGYLHTNCQPFVESCPPGGLNSDAAAAWEASRRLKGWEGGPGSTSYRDSMHHTGHLAVICSHHPQGLQ